LGKENTVETIGFVGSGNMAEALLSGVLKAGMYGPQQVYVSDIRPDRLEFLNRQYGVQIAADNADLASKVDVLVLSVKPQVMKTALGDIKPRLRKDALVISIAAGVRTSVIASVLGDAAIIRVMPNMPAWVGAGAAALFANARAQSKIEKGRQVFLSVGIASVVASEDLLDAVTAVSGSGPAYYFLLMQEMIKAAVALGLPEKDAWPMVIQTAKGAALLAEKAMGTGDTPAQLSARVATPNGTTEAAFKVFAARGFGDMVSAALTRAAERSKELSAG
jgi:pyrroline-5-carboxylate reductase